MGRKTILFMFLSSVTALVHSARIWDGACGRPGHTTRQVAMVLSASWSDHLDGDIGRRIAHHMETQGHLNTPQDLLDKNPWQMIIFGNSTGEVLGIATLIRVRPDVNSSDIAITRDYVCTRTKRYRVSPVARFLNRPELDERVAECWMQPEHEFATEGNGLSILKLANPVPIGDTSPIQAVCLPDYEETMTSTPGRVGTVVGLQYPGLGFHVNQFPSHLRPLHLRIPEFVDCHRPHATPACFCVVAANEGTEGFGLGDTESAFITDVDGRYVMLGMPVYVRGGRRPFTPSLVTRMSRYLRPDGWFEYKIKQTSRLWIDNEMN